MRLSEEEQEFILLLGQAFEKNAFASLTEAELAKAMGMTQDGVENIIARLAGRDLFQCTSTSIHPRPRSLEVAREIEHQRREAGQPPDLVEKVIRWCRRRPVTAGIILVLQALGALVGLVGGILGIAAFFRK